MTEKDKKQVRMDRVKRYEAAPFATEHSLNLQKKQMSDIENQLVKLGLEKTMLETELMKNESLARKRMDARHKQKKLESRLGEIMLVSSKLRQELRRVEGRWGKEARMVGGMAESRYNVTILLEKAAWNHAL